MGTVQRDSEQRSRLEQSRSKTGLLMTSNIQRRRTRKQVLLGRVQRSQHRGGERRLEFHDQFLSLRRADGHASRRGGDRRSEQAVRESDEQVAARQLEEPSCRPNHNGVVGRIKRHRCQTVRMQSCQQRKRSPALADARMHSKYAISG